MQELVKSHLAPKYPWKPVRNNFSDDTWISDTTIGIPVNWLHSPPGRYHHSSLVSFRDVDWALAENITSLIATYGHTLATMDKKEFSLIKIPHNLLNKQGTGSPLRRPAVGAGD
jgi:hypothetical protein